MLLTSGHRCKHHALWALALLAWLGMVSMGMAHGMHSMVHVQANSAHAGHVQTSAHVTQSHAIHHGNASGSCSMGMGCHCGSVCYGVMLPQALVLADAVPSLGYRIDLGASVPARIGEPPLHPPSI